MTICSRKGVWGLRHGGFKIERPCRGTGVSEGGVAEYVTERHIFNFMGIKVSRLFKNVKVRA